jgi:hypothetical protein
MRRDRTQSKTKTEIICIKAASTSEALHTINLSTAMQQKLAGLLTADSKRISKVWKCQQEGSTWLCLSIRES